MEEVPTGWQPDPFGLHEQRFISSDGLPTKLVSDGGVRSYDDPPSVAVPRSVVEPAQRAQPFAQYEPAPQARPVPQYEPAQQSQPFPQFEPVHRTEVFQRVEPEPGDRSPLDRQGPTRSILTPPQPPGGGNGQNGHSPTQLNPQSPRLALLCGDCGQRHNAPDGMCPQCGGAPRMAGLQQVAPAAAPPATPTPAAPAPAPAAAPAAQAPAPPAPPLPDRTSTSPIGAPSYQPLLDNRQTALHEGRPLPLLPPPPTMAGYPPVAPSPSINVFAIASLVLSLIGIPIAGSILAIVFGVIAKRQIKETPGGQGGDRMASWGIALGCLGVVGAVIVVLVLTLGGGRSNALSPGNSPSVATTFRSVSRPLDAANSTLTKALATDSGGSVAQIAQAVTPYVTTLHTFDYKIRQISWTPAEQLQSERLHLDVQAILGYSSTISSATAATWLTHFRALGATAQSADDTLRSMVGLAKVSDFP